jgi:hypothetical protein
MRHARFSSRGLRLAVAGWVLGSAGCTHNYYYGYSNALPGCPPTVVPSTASNGAVCEVPTQVTGGSVVAEGSTRTTTVGGGSILSGSRPPRVVVSQPGGGLLGRWRRSDPDSSLATTSVEGAADEPTTTR